MANKKKTTKRAQRAGWGFPIEAKHAHFFIGSVALCGSWEGFRGPTDIDMKKTPDDCAQCRKAVDAVMRLSKAA